MDDIPTSLVPNSLVSVMTRLLCHPNVKFDAQLLHVLMLNLSKTPHLRDANLRVFTGLLAGDMDIVEAGSSIDVMRICLRVYVHKHYDLC